MATLPSWLALDLGGGSVVGLPDSEQAAAEAQFFGEDVYLDVSQIDALGNSDYVVTSAGDYAIATGRDALRQSLLRRTITAPGDWPTLPDYGVGARLYVKEKNTPAKRAELEAKIRAQYMRDPRVQSVDLVTIAQLDDGSPGIQIQINVTPKGRLRSDRALTVQMEIR